MKPKKEIIQRKTKNHKDDYALTIVNEDSYENDTEHNSIRSQRKRGENLSLC